MSNPEVINARISSTSLGPEDHGIFTFVLRLDTAGMNYGFGTFCMDGYDKKKERRYCENWAIPLIAEVLKIVGVEKWEDLKGKLVRLRTHGLNEQPDLGNIIEDVWLVPKDFIAQYEEKKP